MSIKFIEPLDAIVLLGGDVDNRRADLVFDVWTQESSRAMPPLVIATGNHSGLLEGYSGPPEALVSAEYLSAKGIPDEFLASEEESMDHLAAMILTYRYLEFIRASRVGIVTDQPNVERSVWAAERVWGDGIYVVPLGVPVDYSASQMFLEKAVLAAWKIDTTGIESGDFPSWITYLREEHPFHAPTYGNKPAFGAYLMGISYLKSIQKADATKSGTE